MKKVKHHYISETYQRNFANENGNVWYLQPDGRIYESNPTNMFKEGHYNTVSGSLSIENGLAEIEGIFSKVVKEKIINRVTITIEEKLILSVYVSTLLNRVKNRREGLKSFYGELVDWGKDVNTDADNLSEVGTLTSGHGINVNELEDILKDFNPNFAGSSMDTSLNIADIIVNMNWSFLIASQDLFYVSSDNPVNLCRAEAENKYGRGSFGANAGLLHKDVDMVFPVTPKVALLAGWDSCEDLRYLDVTEDVVDQINWMTIRNAEVLFSDNRDVLELILSKSS